MKHQTPTSRSLFTLTLLSGLASAAARELAVPADFATIQIAVDAAADGDVIRIAPGVYTEQVKVVRKTLTLQGEPGAILRAHDAMNVILADAYEPPYGERCLIGAELADITVRNIQFEGERMNHGPVFVTGVELAGSTGRFEDCRFSGFRGAKLWTDIGWAIAIDNLLLHSKLGFPLPDQVGLVVRRCEFTDNFQALDIMGDGAAAAGEERTHFLIEDSLIVGGGPSRDPGPQSGIYVHTGAGGEIRNSRIEGYDFVGTAPDPLNKWAFGILAFDTDWLAGPRAGSPHPVALRRLNIHDNVFRNNQVHINISDGLGADILNNRFEGSSTGHRPFGIVLSGGPNRVAGNRFEDLPTAIFLLGADAEIGSAFGPAHDTAIVDNRVCGVVRPVETNPNVTGTRESGTLKCPFPVPPIAIARAAQLSWATDGELYRIESAPAVGGPWTDTGMTPIVDGLRSTATVPAETGDRYFRLQRP